MKRRRRSSRYKSSEEQRPCLSLRTRSLVVMMMKTFHHLLLLVSALLLLGPGISTATGDGGDGGGVGVTCPQVIPGEMIGELWRRTNQLIRSLPKEQCLHRRLLPRFCTRCPEHLIGWLEIHELVNVYWTSVFNRQLVHRLLPPHFTDLLHRLQHTLQHCVSSSRPSQWFKVIKKLEKKLKKRNRDKAVLKAAREFIFILRWIEELSQHRAL